MNKKLGLKVLLQNPLAVITEGIRVQQQQYFKKKIKNEYNIDQLQTIDILDLIPNLNEKIDPYTFLTGTSLISDLVLLKSLARKFDNCAYFEIGSWRGESLANMSEVTNNLTSLTLSKEEMKELKFSDEFINIHGVFSDQFKEITKIEHNSHTFDFGTLDKTFDLIFVDGDHSYEGVLNDTKKVFPLRTNNKSIIVWHDYGFDTESVRYSTLKAILDGIPQDKHKNIYHVSNTICAVYIEDLNIKTSLTRFPSFPNKKFSVTVTAQPFKKD